MTNPSNIRVVALAAFFAVTASGTARAQLWRAGPPAHAPRANEVRCFSEGRVLPAGIYFGGNRYEIALQCPAPSGFLVMRTVRDAASATAAIGTLRTRGLAPGYPWVVERRTIGLDGQGLALVVGTFATSADASAYRARFADLDLEYAERSAAIEAAARLHDSSSTGGVARVVTQVVAPNAVHAYAAADIARIDSTFTGDVDTVPHETYVSRLRNEWMRRLAAARPVCDVAPESVFDITIASREHDSSRSWSAVRCGERIAYVPREATNNESVVWTRRNGSVRITQVTLVECDCATQNSWTLEGGVRTRVEHIACHGC